MRERWSAELGVGLSFEGDCLFGGLFVDRVGAWVGLVASLEGSFCEICR